MPAKFANNARTTLFSAINAVQLSFSVTPGGGAAFPPAGGSDYFYATITDADNIPEIVKVTSRTGDTMVVVRGQDGTAARTFTSGANFYLGINKAVLEEFARADLSNLSLPLAYRFKADFSNATITNRVMFQTSTANSVTNVSFLPSGAGVGALSDWYLGSDVNNSSFTRIIQASTETSLQANRTGTGTFLPITFYTSGSERVRIDTNGLANFHNEIRVKRSIDNDGVIWFGSTNNNYIYSGNTNNIMAFATNGTERMRIDASGNVGVGTSPSVKFHIFDPVLPVSRISNNTTAMQSYVDANFGVIGTITNHPLVLIASNAERMRIDASGNATFTGNVTATQATFTGNVTAPNLFGPGQTWQNVSGSRALGTTYYNTTGKPIGISWWGDGASGANNSTTVVINGVTVGSNTGAGAAGWRGGLQFIVPPGASYLLNGGGGISGWFEYR